MAQDQSSIGAFKQWLSAWIVLAMAGGLVLAASWPSAFQQLGSLALFEVNPVTALLVWLLILPTMVQIDYSRLGEVWTQPAWRSGSLLTLSVNWFVKPLSMALLSVLFIKGAFSAWITPDQADAYVAGLILLGIAPCTGMVFVWSRMTGGNALFTLAQVSANDVVLIFAFAPLAGLLLGIGGISVPWATLTLSTLAYVILPLLSGHAIRRWVLGGNAQRLAQFDDLAGPLTKAGLLLLVVFLSAIQAEAVLANPVHIGLLAVPLILQSVLIFALALGVSWCLKLPAEITAPVAIIGGSNFFELAVAVAIAMFGPGSPAVIATIAGVMVEVPIMLVLVAFLNRTKCKFATRSAKLADVNA
jgi:ACR3 family arsenite transporter